MPYAIGALAGLILGGALTELLDWRWTMFVNLILAVPTAIAGIYGMNFKFMPELNWHNGYFIVLGTIAAICVGLWWRFRRIGWL